MKYKDTLNLPKTSFSMRANLAKREPERIEAWQGFDVYNHLRKKRSGKDKYILHDGPPYANGPIHIGHALNKILKDIIIKFKFLDGFDCPFVVGWDCHGLPVEHQLFKEIKRTKHDVDVIEFRKKAHAYAEKFVKLQTEDFKRLGIFADWENPYLTFNPGYEYSVMKLLKELNKEGYIYRGRKPVNWCSTCETALAEAEVEYKDKKSESIYFLFKAQDLNQKISENLEKEAFFCVWTTTPWTVVSNVAVAVKSTLVYNLVSYKDKYIVIAQDLQESLEAKLDCKLKVVKTIPGKDLQGVKLTHPFLERTSPVVLADFISSDEGTGCVHIAPGHGQEDFSLQRKYNLEIIMPVAEDGRFIRPEEFKGRSIYQANELVINKLKEKEKLVWHESINHSYPHCWRCKRPIIFRATYQWFFNVDHNDLRKKLFDKIDQVNWVPPNGQERMKTMIRLRPDWCLSRQRLWGAPIPALKCESCQKVFLDSRVISKTADVFKEHGSNSWFSNSLEDFLPENFNCPGCGGKEFVKEFDILDVWFESGASFKAVLESRDHLHCPADLYLEGSDQHRGWFQVSLMPAVASKSLAPFRSILTHGFVVDQDGKKMSKSLGNVIAPQDISKKYGAEILRLWTAYSDYREDVKISEDIIKQLSDLYRKIRNTIRYILGNICDFNPEEHKLDFSELTELDRYMLSKTMLFFAETRNLYNAYSFYKVCQTIFSFCNQLLSSFYLDILKDRLYTHAPDSQTRRSAQFVLSKILFILLKLISPILSFTAEEAYSCWEVEGKDLSIFTSEIKDLYKQSYIDQELLDKWEKLISLRQKVLKEIEKKREEDYIGSSLQAHVVLSFNKKEAQFYRENKENLTEIFIVSEVTINEAEFNIEVKKAEGQKCIRCWNWKKDIGENKEFPQICTRCVKAIKEAGYEKKEQSS
ncbi:MAG: isoleucine--tRNA ligase [Candidatus Omnitrophica bacterium]|nr:isoleucine--tRNA ligase [Candidatus Omnitrophota bacterium]MCF7892049.1 isoleucine--tRNA ligase [Candidatus Omnitrophota bacterium]MCF7897715.1 isoleucine--tRNA ligase [Candidatus Omnitrophota bacterium]MCF7909552.1 isoleucine--tRNA ligase [Candidatus Omnitrophota bacterium]